MMFEAQILEMPFVAELPKREKSKLHKLWDAFFDLREIVAKTGILVPQAAAARLLGVSPQRVGQLIGVGKLDTHVWNGSPWVTENSLIAFAESERKSGRPFNTPRTGKESVVRAFKKNAK